MRHDVRGVGHPGTQGRRRRLGWVLGLGTLLILGIGCGVQNSRLGPGTDFNGGFRWAAGDMDRLLRNAHYFKLMGQPELGVKELEEAHRLAPGDLKVTDALAQYYDEVGLGTRAQQLYLEALALAPDNPALQNNLGFSYYRAGNWDQAEACYRQALARQPDNQMARNNLGLVLCRQGRQAEAQRLWQAVEGETAAARKLAEALAALGMAEDSRYAQQARPQHREQSGPRHSLPGETPSTASAGPPHSPAPAPRPETAARPLTPSPAVAAAKVAAALPAKPTAADSGPREMPVPRAAEDRVTPAAAPSPQPAPGKGPVRPLPPPAEIAAAQPPPAPLPESAASASSGKAPPRSKPVVQPGPPEKADKIAMEKSRTNSRGPITVRELMETQITILNGNGIHDLARDTRSQLHLEGYSAVDINNFRDFGVERTVIYYRPEAERVAANLNKRFFPGAELKPAPGLTDSIDVKVVLGRDLGPQQQAEVPQARGPRL